jgi:hypothetical protein
MNFSAMPVIGRPFGPGGVRLPFKLGFALESKLFSFVMSLCAKENRNRSRYRRIYYDAGVLSRMDTNRPDSNRVLAVSQGIR